MLSTENIGLLLQGITHVTPQSLVMIAVAFGLLYLGIVKQYEPLLLLPIGAGCMLANLPLSPLMPKTACCVCSTTWASSTSCFRC
jgi:Na+-transporting methylmalonyl-CoA/oxaloacetate decarboxylase beta subunit